jgi:hypothetical protein
VEHGVAAADAESGPRRRVYDAVPVQVVPHLDALQRAGCVRAEDPVGAQAETALEEADRRRRPDRRPSPLAAAAPAGGELATTPPSLSAVRLPGGGPAAATAGR